MKENKAHTPIPWPEPIYDNDTGASDESFHSWWEIEGVARVTNEADAMFAWTAVNSYTALLEAAKANMAWHVAEDLSLGTFQARMELCSYSQWLTRKALGEVSDYQGVPQLLLDPTAMRVELARCDVEGCKALVKEALERAAIALAEKDQPSA